MSIFKRNLFTVSFDTNCLVFNTTHLIMLFNAQQHNIANILWCSFCTWNSPSNKGAIMKTQVFNRQVLSGTEFLQREMYAQECGLSKFVRPKYIKSFALWLLRSLHFKLPHRISMEPTLKLREQRKPRYSTSHSCRRSNGSNLSTVVNACYVSVVLHYRWKPGFTKTFE